MKRYGMIRDHLKSPYVAFICMSIILALSFSYSPSYSQKKEDPDIAMREYMIRISRQLGVTCNHCHNVKDFKDASMKTWKVAKEHMQVVHLLNTQGFVGQNALKVDCYMCHRGEAKYRYRE